MQDLSQRMSLASYKSKQANALSVYSAPQTEKWMMPFQRRALNRSSAPVSKPQSMISKNNLFGNSLVRDRLSRNNASSEINLFGSDRTLGKETPRNAQLRSITGTASSRNRNGGSADWTVMVYMSGDDLERYAINDFLEMSRIGSNQNVNIVVQLDRTATNQLWDPTDNDNRFGNWTNTRRGLIRAGDTPGQNWGTSLGEVDMGSESAMRNFTNWGMRNFRAKNYALVMWGHGDGLAVAPDDGTRDGITGRELNSVLGKLPDRIDVVGTDACFMGMTEFAYEIADRASVFVGSQDLVPGEGWSYTSILRNLSNAPRMNARQLGETIVNRLGQHYNSAGHNSFNETFSAINLSVLRGSNPNGLAATLNNFASTLMTSATSQDLFAVDGYRDRFSNVFDQSRQRGLFQDYCDVGNVFSGIANDLNISLQVRSAASSVLNTYNSAVISNYSAVPGQATGLSIYFSDKGYHPASEFSGASLSFSANTFWDDFLSWANW